MRMSGTLNGVVPIGFPSMKTRAPRGRESTNTDPVKVCDSAAGADRVGSGRAAGGGAA